MDLLVIAVSDVNKPLLKSAIPVLVKALRVRGENNEEMVVDIIKILLQLTFDRECMKALEDNKLEILSFIEKHVHAPKYDVDARLSAQNLVNVLRPPVPASPPSAAPAPAPPKTGSRFSGMVRRATRENKELKALAVPSGGKHVMLSYNWGVKRIVQRVDDLLRANGVKTWIDE
jgi:hypothetical protein